MQRRTYPFVSVILSPGSKIGHTPRKNPSAYWRRATSRINAYRGLRRTLVTFRPSLSQPRMIIAHVSRRCKCFLGIFLIFFEKILRFAERRGSLFSTHIPCRSFGIFAVCSGADCARTPLPGRSTSLIFYTNRILYFILYVLSFFACRFQAGSSVRCQPVSSLTQRTVPSQATPSFSQGMTSAPAASSNPQPAPRRTTA